MTGIRSQQGLAAAAIILVIILGAIALMLGRGAFQPTADLGRREVTTERMIRVSKALVDFAKLQARLPCPARGDQDTGEENRTAASADCTKDSVSANDGVVPWKTLALRRDDALDGWGRKISYRVYSGATGFTQDSGINMTNCNTSLGTPISALGTGSLCQSAASPTPPPNTPTQYWAARTDMPTVQDLGTAKSNLAFVLISHGETGYGSFIAEGASTRTSIPAGRATEETTNAGAAGTYHILQKSDTFDDALIYMSASDLIANAKMASRSWSDRPLSTTFSASAVEAAAPSFDSSISQDTGLTSLSMGGILVTATANGASRNVGFREQSGIGGIGVIGGSSTSGDLNSSLGESLTFQLGTGSEFGKMDVALNAYAITDRSPLRKERAGLSFWKGGAVVQTATLDAWEFQSNPSRCSLRLVSGGTFDRLDVAAEDQSNSGGSSRFTVAGLKACTDSTGSCSTSVSGAVDCPMPPPSASTGSATSIAKTTATLTGTVEDNGVTKGTGSGYRIINFSFSSIPVETTSLTLSSGTGTILAGNCITIAGDANTYVVATALSGSTLVIEDPGLLVSIPAGFPTIRNVTVTNCQTALSFDFGTTCSFGSTVTSTPATINAGSGSTSVAAAVTGLTCNTGYCYRTKAVGLRATTTGNDVTFTTASCS